MKMDKNKRLMLGLLVLFVVAGMTYWLTHRSNIGSEDPVLARSIIDATTSQSIDKIQAMSQPGVAGAASTWVPAISKYINENYGAVKDQKFESSNDGSASVENDGRVNRAYIYKVNAERGSFEMQIVKHVVPNDGKVEIVLFRFPPSNTWTLTGSNEMDAGFGIRR